MDLERHLCALDSEGVLLAGACERAGLEAPVPTCPGWKVEELLRHVGYVHRWAAAHVSQASPCLLEDLSEQEVLARGPDTDELLAWFRDGHASLTRTLRSADAGLSCWTFLDAPTPLAFWARRQAHETAIHRADAESALGEITSFDPGFASDGIDELLIGFAPRERHATPVGDPCTFAICASDTHDDWLVTFGHETTTSRGDDRGDDRADCRVAGYASDLYLALWNRTARDGRISVTGDPRGLDRWRATMKVEWT